MIYKMSKIALGSAILLSAFLAPNSLSGQEKNEEVTIIAPYNPTVTTAQKINRNPRITLSDTEALPSIDYSIRSQRVNTAIAPENPIPSRVPGDPPKKLFRSHLRAGFGNYLTPYVELWVNSLQSDRFKAGAHIGYISSFGQIKDYANSNMSNTLAEAFATKYFNENAFGVKLSYSNNMIHRYGFKPDEFPLLDVANDDLKQVFQKAGFNLGLNSNNADDDAFNYHINLDGYYFFDKYQSNETNINVTAGLSKKMDLFNNGRSQELGLDIGYDQYMNKDSLSDYNGGILSLKPFFDMDLSPYRILVGLKADYRLDSASKFHFYPVIKAEARLLENMVVVYAGMDGGLERISYANLSAENPYVNSILPLNYANNKYNFYGGVKGRISEVMDFNAGIRYSRIENLHMFVNDTSMVLGNTFDIIYDDAGVLRFMGEIGFRSKSNFGLQLKAEFNSYSMEKEEKAWHLPAIDVVLGTYYVVKEKLTLSADIEVQSGLYARTFTNGILTPTKLDGWVDLSIGGEYRINSQFSAFLKLNNVLNTGYFKWYQYPVQKFNAFAGIGFSF